MSLHTPLVDGATTPTRSPRTAKGKLNRYTAVSIGAAIANIIFYSSWLHFTGLHPTVANVLSAAMVTLPTFYLNRRWTWQVQHKHSTMRELVPYYLFTALNVTLSSTLAWFLARRGTSDPVLVTATFSVYATTWLVRFFFLDKILFRAKPEQAEQA